MSEEKPGIDLDRAPDSVCVTDVEVGLMAGLSRVSVWRNSKPGGTLPAPIKTGKRSTRWRLGEVREALGLSRVTS